MKSNKDFAKSLEERTLQFSVMILKFTSTFKYSIESQVVRKQLSRCATSVGANYREANRARSKRDFKNKIGICVAEASETLYWLEIINKMKFTDHSNKDIFKEAKELLALFTSIHKKLNT